MQSIQSTLAKNPEFYKETINLIELSFLYTPDNQYEVDFYPLMEPTNNKNNHILIVDKKVVAHIGVQLRPLGWQGFQVPTALLGGIAVHPDYRGKGLLKDFLNKVINQYEDQVCFFFLWSDLSDLYKKFQFYQAGGQFQTGEKELDEIDGYRKTNFSKLSKQEFSQVQYVYENSMSKYFTGFLRSQRDWSSIKEMSSVDLYLKEDDEKILAYFCKGKGHDLKNIIHEVCAPIDMMDAIVTELQEYKLWLPEIYNSHFKNDRVMYTAFFRVGNRRLFSEFINNWSRGEVTLLNQSEGKISFSHKNSAEHNCTEEEFLTFIFGPCPLTEFQEYGRPLYISGLDSV